MSEDTGVGTFTWEGHTIANPFKDETARFPVTPHHYGFEITNTGGGCEAWVRDEAPGVELWVSGLNGDAATWGCWGWIIGLYYMGNPDGFHDEMEPIWSVTVGADGERKIEIADPDPRPPPDIKREVLLEALNWCEIDAANPDCSHHSQEMLEARVERLRDATARAGA